MQDKKPTYEELAAENETLKRLLSDKKPIHDVLQENELSLFFDLIPDMVVIASTEGKFLKLNTSWESVLGFTIEELKARPFVDFIHPDDVQATFLEVEKQLNRQSTSSFTNRYLCKDGQYKWLDWVSIPSPDGKHLFAACRDITEKKRIEEELRKSEERFRQVTRNSGIWVWEVDVNGLYTYVSDSEESVLGYNPNDLIGKKYFHDFFLPELKEELKKSAMDVFSKKQYFSNFENPSVHKDGHVVILETNGAPMFDQEGKLIGYRGADKDISERKVIEKTLVNSEEKFRQLFLTNPDSITINLLQDGRYVSVNNGFTQIFGYSAEEIIGKTSLEIKMWCVPEQRSKFVNDLRSLGAVENYEVKLCGKGGKVHDCLLSATLIEFEGEPHILTTTKDITERKKADKEIFESTSKLKAALESMTDAVFISDTEGRIIEINEAFATFHKFENKEECSQTLAEYPDILEVSREGGVNLPFEEWAVSRALRGESSIGSVYSLKRKDTGETWVGSYSFAPILNNENEIVGSVVTARDITRQKHLENALITSEKEFRLLAESMPHIVWITRGDGQSIYINQQWVEYTGMTLEESYGDGWNKPFHPDDQQRAYDSWQRAVATLGIYSLECRLRRNDGIYRWWLIRGIPVEEENGRVNKWFGTCTDIDQIKQSENQLVTAKKIAEENNLLKSRLLSNLSHEIRTPMNAIMGFSNLIPEADEHEKNTYAEIIKESSSHLLKLLDDVILLSRLQSEKMPVESCEFMPSEMVGSVHRMFQHAELKKGLKINMHIPQQCENLMIVSDESKVRQILLNLVSNAIKYTFKGSVEIGFNFLDEVVEFYVEDTGIGIAEQEKDRIFETFFRGDQAHFYAIRGNGLGLSISKELAGSIGISIAVKSHPGRGSRFSFTVPFVPSEIEPKKDPPGSFPKKGLAHMNILVAEDEPINQQLIEILLRDLVAKIDLAANGKEAVEMISANKYDLVLMDIKMPVMGGIEATQIIKNLYPEMAVVAQSAYTLPEEKQTAMKAGFDDFLSKPIRKDDLISIIQKYS